MHEAAIAYGLLIITAGWQEREAETETETEATPESTDDVEDIHKTFQKDQGHEGDKEKQTATVEARP